MLEITGGMRVFKHIINLTTIKPARATFHSVFVGYDGDLVCSEIWARASSCVITYFDKKKNNASLFIEMF